MYQTILAIETSFDDTSVAILKDGHTVLAHVSASSLAKHEKYGGVVPEIAAREQLQAMVPVLQKAISIFPSTGIPQQVLQQNVDAFAVTIGPGLVGSLALGVEAAKSLALVCQIPLIPVHHVQAHLFSPLITYPPDDTLFPAIGLVASGGHTELYYLASLKNITWLGGTIDDAAGEALDKIARVIGLGHGGGKALEQTAALATSPISVPPFPRPLLQRPYEFSFSGLKTAVRRYWQSIETPSQKDRNDVAYQAQQAIIDVLIKKTIHAAKDHQAKSIWLGGGVAANTLLRTTLEKAGQENNFRVLLPDIPYTTDNAAMIACMAYYRGESTTIVDCIANPSLPPDAGLISH